VSDGFPIYKSKNLAKVNSLRRAASLVSIESPPILDKAQVLFSTSEERNGEPCSCYNCEFFNAGASCYFFGPGVNIRKFVYPPAPTADAKQIEYWPVCGLQHYGKPNKGRERFADHLADPDNSGLCWINAPRVGQEYGGANCGGTNGGDDCDYYDCEGDDKRAAPTGTCRVIQTPVANGDVCAAWKDDDLIGWREAQTLLQELDN